MPSHSQETDRRAQRSRTLSKKATFLNSITANGSFDSPASSPMTPDNEYASGFLTPIQTEGSEGTPPQSPHYSMEVQRGGTPPPYAVDRLKNDQDADLKDSASFQLPWPKGKSESKKDVAHKLDAALKITTDPESVPSADKAISTEPANKAVAKRNHRVIGVDFDDVCAQFIPVVQREHNARYGTKLSEEDMQTYVFFQTKGWGTPAETARKMRGMDRLLPQTAPVPGFVEALKALHAMGHPIHVVTARAKTSEPYILDWLAELGVTVGVGENDVIAALWFTDSYGGSRPPIPEKGDTPSAIEREDKLNEQLREIWKDGIGSGKGGKSKLKVLRAINASLFVDDHHGNLEPIIHADPPVPCLLFGKYPWNRSRSGVSSPVELMSYDERMLAGLDLQLEEITECDKLARAETWEDVVAWVKNWDEGEAAKTFTA